MTQTATFNGTYKAWQVDCPKHGKHTHSISSTIKGHEGRWCQICWIESLGPALPAEQIDVTFGEQHD
jgi:hypothetical protein